MSATGGPPLPPGWHAQWDPSANRYAFIESATGRAQFNHPAAGAPPPGAGPVPLRRHGSRPSMSAAAGGAPRPAQSNAGLGASLEPQPRQLRPQPSFNMSAPAPPPGQGGYAQPGNGFSSPPLGQQPRAPLSPTQPQHTPTSPRLAANPVVRGSRRQYAANTAAYIAGDAGHSGQPSQFNGAPDQGYGQQQPQSQFFSPGDQGPQQGGYGGYAGQDGYGSPVNDGYGGGGHDAPPAAYGGAATQQLTNQFGQMGMGGGGGMTGMGGGPAVRSVNLIGMGLNPAELANLDPPPIKLPPNASFTENPMRNADPSYQRCTMNAIPANEKLLKQSKVPLSLVITPYRSIKAGDPEVPICTDTVIARCRRCRMYINPFVTFIEGGQRWRCCVCGLANQTPQLFDWDQETNEPVDRYLRPELNYSVVDFVASTEYMIRPPQPPLYVFLIDLSYAAITSGMVATAARTLLESLSRIPDDDGRTKISIIGVDSALHFFTFPAGEAGEPSTLVVGDLDDVFLPKPTDILVNLVEAKAAIEALLGRLGEMYKNTSNVGHALGPALQAAFKLLSHVGGKVIALSATLPNLGPGALKDRNDTKVLGTPKESTLLQAANAWYKTFAIECSRSQISVDLWLFSSAYTDVATLSGLPRYTGGNTYYYPGFSAARQEDALKFAHEFGTVVADPTPFEAVIRVRASKGLRLTAFHGNFFVRSTDLLSLPSVPIDQSYCIELTVEDPISAPFVVLQTGIMHTTAFGERRIRVITQALPVTNSLTELYASVDQYALATLMSAKAVEKTNTAKLEDAREQTVKDLVEILGNYKGAISGAKGPSPQLVVGDNFKFLPILMMGLLKNLALRQSAMIPSDMRAYAQSLLTTLPTQLLIPFLHPTFFSLHNMPAEAGTVSERGVILPPPLPLTIERLERHGLFLLEDGQNIFLWIGSHAVPQLVQDVFAVPSYAELRGGKVTLPRLENDFNERVNAIVGKVREMRRGPYYPHLYLVKEDGEPSLRQWALSLLIEDRADQLPTYAQFLTQLKDKVNDKF